ncbi:MAG TPA: hypothetical protein VLJ39_15005 [Tepidisphaeraceae bacterium]|jgi:hypothetical protein|nr:hypothetical protein [Tepidisphaeraceae bacterium]
MNRYAVVVVAALFAGLLIGDRSRAADPDGRPSLPGLDQTVAEFWGRWEGVKPSEAIRRANPNADFQRTFDDLGARADDFQVRSGGRCLGHSEYAHKSLGESMQYFAFFALYDPTPVRVQLLLYRAKDTWTIISIRMDAEPSRWLDEAGESVMPTPPAAPAQ